jgi:hypothetical protein
VTGHDFGVLADQHHCAAVPMVRKAARSGFVLAARNSDCAAGHCGFSWVALEFRRPKVALPATIRGGILHPQGFAPSCIPGDWNTWSASFTPEFNDDPVLIATACDFDVSPVDVFVGRNDISSRLLVPAVVPLARDVTSARFALDARNSDCGSGNAGMYYAAFSPKPAAQDRETCRACRLPWVGI